jgi:hypothetical protein
MEYLEDYDFTLSYHANVVADALSRKSRGHVASLAVREWKLMNQIQEYGLQQNEQQGGAYMCAVIATPALHEEILKVQILDSESDLVKSRLAKGEGSAGWTIGAERGLRYLERLFVPDFGTLRESVLKEHHKSNFVVHPGGNKM